MKIGKTMYELMLAGAQAYAEWDLSTSRRILQSPNGS